MPLVRRRVPPGRRLLRMGRASNPDPPQTGEVARRIHLGLAEFWAPDGLRGRPRPFGGRHRRRNRRVGIRGSAVRRVAPAATQGEVEVSVVRARVTGDGCRVRS